MIQIYYRSNSKLCGVLMLKVKPLIYMATLNLRSIFKLTYQYCILLHFFLIHLLCCLPSSQLQGSEYSASRGEKTNHFIIRRDLTGSKSELEGLAWLINNTQLFSVQ